MKPSIERRLVTVAGRRIWRTLVADESGGNGGSVPDSTVTGPLASIPEPEEGATSAPTLAEIDSSYNVFIEWSAETDYSRPFAFNADQVIVLLPETSANVFAAEINGASTGAMEPDWSSAPNVGDTVADDGVTWTNIMPQASWPPVPVTFAVDTAYAPGTLLWPTTPNGHLYLVYPGSDFEAASEPSPWSIKGNYTSGDTGYALDLGTKLTTAYAGGEVSTAGVPDATALANALPRLFIHMRDRVGYVPGIIILTSENGYAFRGVNNETFILNNPDAADPPLREELVEGGGVLISHKSLQPGDTEPVTAHEYRLETDNYLILTAALGLVLPGLPDTDPGVAGQLYTLAGALMVSDGP